MKIQISPIPAEYLYTNKQQETLPVKVKDEKKIAQEDIRKD